MLDVLARTLRAHPEAPPMVLDAIKATEPP